MCQEIIDGRLHDQFRMEVLQGGAGTSTNMNANEVIENDDRSSGLAAEAMRIGRGILELARKKRLPSEAQIDAVLDPLAMTGRKQFI